MLQIVLFVDIAFAFFSVSGGTTRLERGSPAAIIQYTSIAIAFGLITCLCSLQIQAEWSSRESGGTSILAPAFQFMALLALAR
jgi:hypothetical protein